MTTLRGITWNHTRGYAPMAVTGQVFADRHPGIEVVWDRRSLWAFGEQSLEEVVAAYDLLVVDHPLIGWAATAGALLPVDLHLPPEAFDRIRGGAVGRTQESYGFGGHHYALAIDAACQVAAARPDLLAAAGEELPRTWEAVVSLARRTGGVALPLNAIDAFSAFLTMCAHLGAPVASDPADPSDPSDPAGGFADRAVAVEALARFAELATLVDPTCATANPIAILDRMSGGDEVMYCPLVFGYTNYSRDGYASRPLTFHDIPCDTGLGPRGSCLGGAGLAVSASTAHRDEALAYAAMVGDPGTQRADYLLSGGQPAAAAAWDDADANRITRDFFRSTRRTLDAAYLRPRDPDFPAFQTAAATLVRDAVLAGERGTAVLDRLEGMYSDSRERSRAAAASRPPEVRG